MNATLKTVIVAVRMNMIVLVIAGLLYPLVVWFIAVAGSWDTVSTTALCPAYTDSTLFMPRPSACDYSALPSGASNLGPTSAALRAQMQHRAATFRARNGLAANAMVPADMVCSSASGLDPHISLAAAFLQRGRVARERGVSIGYLDSLIKAHTVPPQFDVLGGPVVNVVSLNDALGNR